MQHTGGSAVEGAPTAGRLRLRQPHLLPGLPGHQMPGLPYAEATTIRLLGPQLANRVHKDVKIPCIHRALPGLGISYRPGHLGHCPRGTAYPGEVLTRNAQNTVQCTPQTRLRHLIRSLERRGTVQDVRGVQQQAQRPLTIATLGLQSQDQLRAQPAHGRRRLGPPGTRQRNGHQPTLAVT